MTTDEPDPREVHLATHWLHHRMCAKGLTGYAESTILEDEWMVHGGAPAEALAAIERREHDLSEWCPILRPGMVAVDGNG